MKVVRLITGSLICLNLPVHATAVYVGYSQAEQTSVIGNQSLALTPSGQSLLVSFDLSEALSFSTQVSRLTDSVQVTNKASGDVDIDSLSATVHYLKDNWSYSLGVNDWQDDLLIKGTGRNARVQKQSTQSKSVFASVGYDWQHDEWDWGLSAGVHMSRWQQDNSDKHKDGNVRSSVEDGDSTFFNLAISGSYFHPISQSAGVMLGSSVSWNELIESESKTVARNGRNIGQITKPGAGSRLSNQGVFGTESYAQVNAYAVLLFADDWSIDINVATDLATEYNSTAISASIGYSF